MGKELICISGSREDVLRVIENYLKKKRVRYRRWDKERFTEYRLGFIGLRGSIEVIHYYSDGKADVYAPKRLSSELRELLSSTYRLYVEGLSKGLRDRVSISPIEEVDSLLRDLGDYVMKYRCAREVFARYKRLALILFIVGLILMVFTKYAVMLVFISIVLIVFMLHPHDFEHKLPTRRYSTYTFTPIAYRKYKRDLDKRLELIRKHYILLPSSGRERVRKELEKLGLTV